MASIQDTYVVCVDCYTTAAGITQESGRDDVDVEPLNLISGEGRIVPGDDEDDFSWATCEGCGSTFAGSRHTVHVIA